MSEAMQRRSMEPVAAITPEVGRWLWALEDTRGRTKEALATVAAGAVDWIPPHGGNTIGALLYHIALIEADYLYADVMEMTDYPQEILALFPYPDRDAHGALTLPPAMSMDQHLQRLATVRNRLLATFATLPPDDFRRPRTMPRYTITPEWTLHHLMQHEAEHRGQIVTLRDFAQQART
jgi:uncharacterized damage-inducible protein DinB